VRLVEPVGSDIRGILHELGSAFELFQDQKIYLVTQAANDLNFTFVIDESQGDRLVQQLHERLIQSIRLGQGSWPHLDANVRAKPLDARALNWWESRRSAGVLLDIAKRDRRLRIQLESLDAAIAAVLSVARQAMGICDEGELASEVLRRSMRRPDAGMRVRAANSNMRLPRCRRSPQRVLFHAEYLRRVPSMSSASRSGSA